MNTTGAPLDGLRIREFDARYLVSDRHPAPERLKDRLNEVIHKNLPEALSNLLGSWFSPDDETVWLIRRLDIAVTINVAWEPDKIAKRWGAQIITRLAAAIQGDGDDKQEVLNFANPASYLASFLIDLAKGHAWRVWYYASFDGLRMLPLSTALRTAISNDLAVGLAALRQMQVNDLSFVLNTLSAQDAHRVLDTFANAAVAGNQAKSFSAAWAAWQGIEWKHVDATDLWRNALRLYVGVRSDPGGPTLRAAVLAIVRLAQILSDVTSTADAPLLAALAGHNLSALYALAGAADAEQLTPFLKCPSAWLFEVSQTLLARGACHAASAATCDDARRYTAFGGLFLLLPLLAEVPLEEATKGWPDAEGATAATLLRILLLSKCCGEPRAIGVFADPLLRDLLGIAPRLSTAHVRDWAAAITKGQITAFMKTMLTWQGATGTVGGRTLLLVSTSMRGRPIALLLDGQRGSWLWAGRYDPRSPDRICHRLRDWIPNDATDTVIICADRFVMAVRDRMPAIRVESFQNIALDASKRYEAMARLDQQSDDLGYLSLPAAWHVSPALDLSLSLVAQNLLRDISGRLPGFALSGLPYLYTNFLDFSGSVDNEPERRVVRLGRPPLNLILTITGMTRKVYRLPWLDERPLCLFQEES